MLKKLSAKFHLAMGLTSIVTSLLLAAILLNMVPDRTQAVIDGRVVLSESIASSSTLFLLNKDHTSVTKNLEFNIERNPDLVAASIERNSDQQKISIGDESVILNSPQTSESTEARVVLPILQDGKVWGEIILFFTSTDGHTLLERVKNSRFSLIGFTGLIGFILFYLYLGKMLQALNPSQAVPGRVRSALDTLAEGLLVVDRKSNVVLANKAFQELAGEDVEALIGKKADSFRWHNGSRHPDESTEDKDKPFPWSKAMTSKETLRGEQLWLQHHDDTWHKFLVNCSPIITGKTTSGVLISLDDVTELEEKEKELILARDAAEEANKAKSNFLSNMSHEIRTPMTAILGFTEVLKRGSRTADSQWEKHLNTISSSGKHLLELINDVLDLSKVESGALEVEQLDCAVHIVASDVVQVLRVRAEEKDIALEIVVDDKLPEHIQSDSSRLRQIITNLVGNAIKFTEKGGVQIVLRTEEIDGKSMFAIDVKDSGIGMTTDQQAAVFKPFVQADSSITRRFGGTGLGLAISRKLARALGGDIIVSSEANVGTTFTAIVEAGSLDNVTYLTPEQIKSKMAETETAEQKYWDFPKCKLLVIDDAAENRELLTLVLNDLGLETDTAENGAVGVEMAGKYHYNVILSDIQMPVMDGYEAVKAMRENGIKQPVIALTANAMKGYEETILSAGFSHYMTKPIDIDALTNLLAQLLGGKAKATPPARKAHTQPAVTAEAATVDSNQPQSLIYSRLGGSEKLGPVVDKFIEKLRSQIPEFENAAIDKDYQELVALGHWLKGSGGTIGFDVFLEPAKALEDNAKVQNHAEVLESITQIKSLTHRLRSGVGNQTDAAQPAGFPAIERPSEQAQSSKVNKSIAVSPVVSHLLAKDPAFRPIVMKFLPRLREQLIAMENAILREDYTEVANLAHWLKGSGGTVGFDVFTKPAAAMESYAGDKNAEKLTELLNEIKIYSDNIVVPGNDESDASDLGLSA